MVCAAGDVAQAMAARLRRRFPAIFGREELANAGRAHGVKHARVADVDVAVGVGVGVAVNAELPVVVESPCEDLALAGGGKGVEATCKHGDRPGRLSDRAIEQASDGLGWGTG